MKVKICGVTRPEDALVAVGAGADFVGAVLSPGFGRSVTAAHARTYLPPAARGEGPSLVAVMVDPEPAEAAEAARTAGAAVVQLHGDESPQRARDIADAGPWTVWKAVRVTTGADVRRAVETYGSVVDGLLLDGARSGERGGGHGVRFPWEAAEEARDALDALLFVAAGGLEPGSVGEVVRRLRPDVVDVSSGVEDSPGVKDPGMVTDFVRNARAAAGS